VDHQIGSSRLGDLTSIIDQDDVIGCGMTRRTLLVDLTIRRLVEERDIKWIHWNAIHAKSEKRILSAWFQWRRGHQP
jgi:hypothetical protein